MSHVSVVAVGEENDSWTSSRGNVSAIILQPEPKGSKYI